MYNRTKLRLLTYQSIKLREDLFRNPLSYSANIVQIGDDRYRLKDNIFYLSLNPKYLLSLFDECFHTLLDQTSQNFFPF